MFAEISTRLGGERMTFTFSWFERNCETIFMCNSSQTSVCVLFFVFFVVLSKMKDMLRLFPRLKICCGCFQDERYFVVVSKMKDMWYLVGWLIYIVCRAVIFKQVHLDHCWPRAPFIK